LLAGAMIGGLALVNVYALLKFNGAGRGAARAASNAAEVAALAADIRVLRSREATVGTAALGAEELARRTEQVASAVGIARKTILRITPAQARRVTGAPYLEQQTQVILNEASLRQVLTLLEKLDEEWGLCASAVRLNAPRDVHSSEGWQVELTLNYLVYAPLGNATRAAAEGR
jgi:hypothetical protein